MMTLFRKFGFFTNNIKNILKYPKVIKDIHGTTTRRSIHLTSKFYTDQYGQSGQHVKGVVLGVWEKEEGNDPKLTPSTEKFDDNVSGKLMELIRDFRITGQIGKVKIFSNLHPDFKQVAVVGLGKEGLGYNELEMLHEGRENVRVAAGLGARKLQEQGCNFIAVDPMEYAEQAATGAHLGIFIYQNNKRKQDRIQTPQLDLYESANVDEWTRGVFKAEAQNLARKLSDAPANQMTPTCFAQATVDTLCPCGINVEVRTMDWIEAHRLNSFLTIARSSCEPPVFLEIGYCGAAVEDKPILLVGKGLTFNSGGICLKNKCDNMAEFRACMAGAAVVVSTIRAAAALSLPVNVNALIPLCENMPSGMAPKPGDVITCLNGKTLAIEDTSNAGVVVLADTLAYGLNYYKPKIVIDVATISDGIEHALGGGAAGVYSTSHFVWEQLQKAGALSGDRLWRMPLWNYYRDNVTCYNNYDVGNKGTGSASSCLAAAILREFVSCTDWAHIDIRGVGMYSKTECIPYLLSGRMTGRPTRTLIQFLYQLACPEAQSADIREL